MYSPHGCFGWQGQAALQHLINIHFTVPDLWPKIADRPAMLYFAFNPDVIAVLVAHDIRKGEFVAQVRAQTYACIYAF
jgi:hypothetical protein